MRTMGTASLRRPGSGRCSCCRSSPRSPSSSPSAPPATRPSRPPTPAPWAASCPAMKAGAVLAKHLCLWLSSRPPASPATRSIWMTARRHLDQRPYPHKAAPWQQHHRDQSQVLLLPGTSLQPKSTPVVDQPASSDLGFAREGFLPPQLKSGRPILQSAPKCSRTMDDDLSARAVASDLQCWPTSRLQDTQRSSCWLA